MADTKLVIQGYHDDPLASGANAAGGDDSLRFEAWVNPEKFTLQRGVQMSRRGNSHGNKNSTQLKGAAPAKLSFELMLDGTGVIEYNNDKNDTVEDRLAKLQAVVFEYEGEIHKQNYLRVSWNRFIFYCHLESLQIECNLFNKDGKVLRAKVNLSFVEHSNPSYNEKQSWNRSPDLTHLKTVRDGDTILQMTHDVYKNSKYYLEIARTNNLINFRELNIGQQLTFPPLDK
ncbi:MAG: hypothetical protein AAFO07_01130 [Bacteroidota bacterium]